MRRSLLLGLLSLALGLAGCDSRVAAPRPPMVQIRVLHAARNAPPLDVYLTAPGASLVGASPLVEPFTFGVDTTRSSGFVERAPGDYEVRFTADNTTSVVLSTGNFSTVAGQLITVVLSDDELGGLVASVLRK